MGKAFWRYFVAQAISVFGSYVGRFALSVAVYEATGSIVAMGAIALISAIPENILRLLGAPLIDRFPRLKFMASLDLARFVLYLVPWLIWETGHPSVSLLYALALGSGITNALYSPAAMAIIPTLAPPEKLAKANALMETVYRTIGITGPIVGATLAAFIGSANTLMLDGLSFGICGLVLATTAVKATAPLPSRSRGLKAYGAELLEGFMIFREIPALLSITAVLAISNIGSTGSTTMLLPFIRDHLGGSNWLLGATETAVTVGLLAASIFATTFTLKIRRRFLMLGGLLLIQISQIIAALLTPSLAYILVIAWALLGFGSSTYSINSATIYQQIVPEHVRGRVMSVRMLVALGLGPIGQALGTFIAARWGPDKTLLICGGIPLLVTLSAFFFPSLRGLDSLATKEQSSNSLTAKQVAPAKAANSSQ